MINIIRDGEEMDLPIKDVLPGDMVMTRDEKTGEKFRTSVIDKHDHGVLDLFEVTLDSGEIVKCTMDHKFRTKCGKMLPLKTIIEMDLEIVTKE
jgi:intein/homing endonuclease